MKPAQFEYERPDTLEGILAVLAEKKGDAKIMAGGQSLVPMLNLRLLRPETLIDINGVTSERYLKFDRKSLHVGMLARHADFDNNPEVKEKLPLLARVVKDVAHVAIRNRGTFCGSVCHNDPSAEWPLMSVLLDAEMEIRSHKKKRREKAQNFFANIMTTTLAEDELLTGVRLMLPDKDAGWSFAEFNRRLGDFAIVSAAAIVRMKGGKIREAKLALGGVAPTVTRMTEVEKSLVKQQPSQELWDQVAAAVSAGVSPTQDLQATENYRRHLAGVYATKVLKEAVAMAEGA